LKAGWEWRGVGGLLYWNVGDSTAMVEWGGVYVLTDSLREKLGRKEAIGLEGKSE